VFLDHFRHFTKTYLVTLKPVNYTARFMHRYLRFQGPVEARARLRAAAVHQREPLGTGTDLMKHFRPKFEEKT
jgi:hypothetical protein